MSEIKNSFYEDILCDIKKRNNEECKLQNEALVLREKCTEMIMNLQNLVSPEKAMLLSEMNEKVNEICNIEPEELVMPQDDHDTVNEDDTIIEEIKKLIEGVNLRN